jgi:membrane-associated protease RseP (regulator of RpoE activity)
VALLLSVGLHELGHLVPAKKFGMKTTRYFIGMGPTLWSTTKGETEYGIKALPIGGFCKIIGMTSIEEVEPEDEPRAFRRASAVKRVIVLAGGSFMHFVLATFLFFALGLLLSVQDANTTQVGTVSQCVPASVAAADNGTCPAKPAGSPASVAGLKVGDKITAVNHQPVTTFDQITAKLKKTKPGTPVPLTVDRGGRSMTLRTTPAAVKGRPGAFLGISPAAVFAFDRLSVPAAVKAIGTGWQQTVVDQVKGISSIPAQVPKLFDKEHASSGQGLTSMVGVAEATGQAVAEPVGWAPKITFILTIMAQINVFVGIFNLLPILPMDGGHILAVFCERVRAWWARLRKRPDPGMFDLEKLMPVSFSIFAVIIAFSLAVLISNIMYPVNIG